MMTQQEGYEALIVLVPVVIAVFRLLQLDSSTYNTSALSPQAPIGSLHIYGSLLSLIYALGLMAQRKYNQTIASSPFNKSYRPNATSGLLMGAILAPLALSSQIISNPELNWDLSPLLCLSLIISCTAVLSAYSTISPAHLPEFGGITGFILMLLPLLANVAHDGIGLVCVFGIGVFFACNRFLFTCLPKSFTAGEATLVSSLFSLTATNSITNTISMALNGQTMISDEIPLLIVLFKSADPVFLACQTIMVGVSLLCVIVAIPFRYIQHKTESSPSGTPPLVPVILTYIFIILSIAFIIHPWIYWTMGREPFDWIAQFFWDLNPATIERMSELSRPLGILIPMRLVLTAYWVVLLVVAVGLIAPKGTGDKSSKDKGKDKTNTKVSNTFMNDKKSSNCTNTIDGTEKTNTSQANSDSNEKDISSSCGSSSPIPNIIIRKYFHGLAACMFIPAVLLEIRWVSLAFAGVAAIFVLLEYMRISCLPPAYTLTSYMQSYLDSRDQGYVVLTHTYLLIGCALPIWLHSRMFYMNRFSYNDIAHSTASIDQASLQAGDIWTADYLPAITGVLILGVGDAAASLVGVYFGRCRWPGTRKTVEGTLGAFVSIYIVVYAVHHLASSEFQPVPLPLYITWSSVAVSTLLTCFLEAFTSQIDNIFLPLYYYAMLLLLR